ncbi:MAG: hypothetical protein AWU54_418 [Candidatus Frackibacter sp. T328-2]|jgi:hypothetical protein|nr:MAG: hypothetical protein AWU54_418 [Candidatus Frackibacter sp. T328-2]
MNKLRYEVKEVLSDPIFVEKDDYNYWKVKVLYATQRGDETTVLIVSSKKIADQVEKGYEFWR